MFHRILGVLALAVAAMAIPFSLVAAAPVSVPTIKTIATGGYHTCAITSDGGVKCWGSNDSGQLGDGTTTQSNIPVDVLGLSSGVSAITAGFAHTCAVTKDGVVKCWGSNEFGQLGDGTTTQSNSPVDVPGLPGGITAIAAGARHTCAVASDGAVKCWGYNETGELGDGTTTQSFKPVDVSGLTSPVTAIAAADFHTCVVTNDGGVRCWGYNDAGELGNGTTTASSVPVDVSGLASGITAVAGGLEHTCALTIGGAVKCWGATYLGKGHDSSNVRLIPVDMSDLTPRVAAIAAGGDHTCAVTSAGGVKCWGLNEYGQLGNGTTTESDVPVDVSGLASGMAAIAVGEGGHSCALTSGGGVECWGINYRGQLGDGTTSSSLVPIEVAFAMQAPPVTDVADPGAHDGPADLPLVPLLAGLGAGLVMLVRRRGREPQLDRDCRGPGEPWGSESGHTQAW